MVVSDLYRTILDSQDVIIYDVDKHATIFDGVCEEIPESYMGLCVYFIFTNKNILTIAVE